MRRLLLSLALLAPVAASAATPMTYATGTNGYGTAITLLSTECNSVANGSYCTLGAEVDNSAGQKGVYADIVWTSGGTMSPASSPPPVITCWLLVAADGTNYEDGSASIVPGRPSDFSVKIRSGTTITPVQSRRQVILPPGKFKTLCVNSVGVSFPSSGNTLKAYIYQIQQ